MILEEVFDMNWIEGIVNIYTRFDRLPKIHLDANLNVIESGGIDED